jgi:ABC-type Fe3+/spermidine/putrescine transport system ATPase subunit
MTVAENVSYGLKLRKAPKDEINKRVPEVLDMVRLSGLGDRPASRLSGGQQQRVAVARALVMEPKVLLFDEPLSNLDAKLRRRVRQDIRELQQTLQLTVVYVTHDQEEALAISDRIAVMRRGRLLQVGPPEEVFEAPAHAFVADFIGGCNWLEATLSGDAVTLAEGPVFTLPPGDARPQGAVRVALRNEDLHLAGADEARPALAGTVLMRAYMGHRTRLHVRLAGGAVVDADLPGGGLPAEGAPVRLAFAPGRARLFTREGEDGLDGRRIA